MKSIFLSKFKDVQKEHIEDVASLISSGSYLYRSFLTKARALTKYDTYTPLTDLYKDLGLPIFPHLSKRKFYESYTGGIIIGAGSGHDCDKLDRRNWHLYDFQDSTMGDKAVGYEVGTVKVNILNNLDASTFNSVSDKHIKSYINVSVVSIDSMKLSSCHLISADVEGAGLDVLAGAVDTLNKLQPDILISIYHNPMEYLMIVPFLYDFGYNIHAVQQVSVLPQCPHIELGIFATIKER